MKELYRIHSILDTETTNFEIETELKFAHTSVCILYIFNDISQCDLREYVPDADKERVHMLRDHTSALEYIEKVITDGKAAGYIPIICAYNLMFDLQTLIYELNKRYDMSALAQSSTHVYTLDLLDGGGNKICRFWDTYYLEMNGLAAMGATCGFAKATGEWDYSLIRTAETPLTDKEIDYAKRDVQVIPAYLRYILESNPHIEPYMLGFNVLTKTGLVRQMARSEIANLYYISAKHHRIKLGYAFEKTCLQETPIDYESYAIRKACFRGGWTFTAAATASKVVENVASLDVVSMHHTFINGRYMPVHFSKKPKAALEKYMQEIRKTTLAQVLERYAKPFFHSFHTCIRFTNMRLKKGSIFERSHIALIPESKFKLKCAREIDIGESEHGKAAEEAIKKRGYTDKATGAVFAFGKLYRAKICELHLNELEYWCICQVYDFDSEEALYGEGSIKFALPPDYIIAQSHTLYKRKQAMKELLKMYKEGVPLEDVPPGIPDAIVKACENGSASHAFLTAYYNSTVKGQFNGIYGTQAQDVYKPDYDVVDGLIFVEKETVLSPDNWKERQPRKHTVFYNYGMRIVAGSRMHLVIACMLIDNVLGSRVDILGGDTDSLKIRCDADVTDDELTKALYPLASASKTAIDTVSARLRRTLPDHASTLDNVGAFEVEKCGDTTRYAQHMELWNKARVSLDSNGHVHVTCAGLSRPPGAYHIENYIEEASKKIGFNRACTLALGYNVSVSNDICHMLQRTHPAPWDIVDTDLTDYKGNTTNISCYEAIALYPENRILGETDKISNMENVDYLKKYIGRDVLTTERELFLIENKPAMKIQDEWGENIERF